MQGELVRFGHQADSGGSYVAHLDRMLGNAGATRPPCLWTGSWPSNLSPRWAGHLSACSLALDGLTAGCPAGRRDITAACYFLPDLLVYNTGHQAPGRHHDRPSQRHGPTVDLGGGRAGFRSGHVKGRGQAAKVPVAEEMVPNAAGHPSRAGRAARPTKISSRGRLFRT